MNKVYTRIEWKNYPSTDTAVNEANLNKMDFAIDEIDKRVVEQDITKANVSALNELITSWTIDKNTGVITIYKVSGEQIIFDLNIEKVPVGFSLTDEGILIMTTDDGTEFTANIGSMIPVLTFNDSDQIAVSVSGEGVNKTYSFSVKTGSITADKLQPNFLADVTLQANSAKTSEQNAKTSEENAKQSEINAKNYADSAEPIASTVSGTNPTLDNSTDAQFISLQIDGATGQQTYSGKNLCKITIGNTEIYGVTLTNNNDGSITLKGTATNDIYFWITSKLTGFKVGEKYVASGGAYCQITKADGSKSYVDNFTFTEDMASVAMYMQVAKDATVDVTYKPMLRNNNTDATYEPYVGGIASPNPDYPQEIHGVGEGGSVAVKTTGKNLLPNLGASRTVNGITFTVNDDKSVTVSGTATNNAYFIINENFTIPAGTILSGCPSGGGDEKYAIHAWASNVDRRVDYGTGISFTNDYATKEIYIVIRSGATVSNLKFYPMIRLTIETDVTYEPYQGETTANIPLSAPLYEGDYIKYNMDGTGELVRKMASVVLDGSESGWLKSQLANTNMYYIAIPDAKYAETDQNSSNVKGCCTHFNMVDSYHQSGQVVGFGSCGFGVISALHQTMIGFNVTFTMDEWKAWLAENPITVVYELAEPTVTPLTAEQIAEFKKLYSFDGVTNVMCEGETEIDYFRDNVNGRTIAMVVKMVKTTN